MPLSKRLAELVMLANRLVNLPRAAHAPWEYNEISSSKANRLSAIRSHRHVPVNTKQVSRWSYVQGNVLMSQPQIGQSRNPSARIVLSGQGDVTLIIMLIQQTFSESLIAGRLTIPNQQSTLPTRRLSKQQTA